MVIGLGNPGSRYEITRHNAGFLLCEHIRYSLSFPPFIKELRFKGEYSEGRVAGSSDTLNGLNAANVTSTATAPLNNLALFRPLTYMNRSGEAVKAVVSFFKLSLERFIVCYDDLDLPMGRIRFAAKGGSGGHKGIQSVISYLSTDKICRLRIGIGRSPNGLSVSDYVLGPFSREEAKILGSVLDLAKEGIMCFFNNGIDAAMNLFNGRRVI